MACEAEKIQPGARSELVVGSLAAEHASSEWRNLVDALG